MAESKKAAPAPTKVTAPASVNTSEYVDITKETLHALPYKDPAPEYDPKAVAAKAAAEQAQKATIEKARQTGYKEGFAAGKASVKVAAPAAKIPVKPVAKPIIKAAAAPAKKAEAVKTVGITKAPSKPAVVTTKK